MSFQNKYLKYKNKYLELKKQIGGSSSSNSGGSALQESNPDDITELGRQFISENSNISDQIISNPIDMRKKQDAIDRLIDTPDRQVIIDLYNSIKHVSASEHEFLIKEFCDRYNQVKQPNDVYILVYIPFLENVGDSGTIYNTKSSLYVTTIAGKYLNYDYIINTTSRFQPPLDQYNYKNRILTAIKNLNIDTNKNIYLHFADDCSYGGEQLRLIIKKVTNEIFTNLDNNMNLYYRFIIPFILSKKYVNMIEEFSIISNYIKNNIDKSKLFIKLQENKNIYKETRKKFDEENKELKYDDYETYHEKENNFYNEQNNQKSRIFIECIKSRQDKQINDLIKTIILGKDYGLIDKLYLFDMYPVLDILKKNNSMVKKVEDVVNGRPSSYKDNNALVYFDTKIADTSSIETRLVQNIVTNPDYIKGQYSTFKYKFNGKQIEFDDTKSFSQLLQSLKE